MAYRVEISLKVTKDGADYDDVMYGAHFADHAGMRAFKEGMVSDVFDLLRKRADNSNPQ